MDRSLTRALTRPRHIVASALVFVFLGATGFAVAGAGQSEGSEPPAAAPPEEWMPVPLPAPGDRGVYSLSLEAAPAGTSTLYGEVGWGTEEPVAFEVLEDRRTVNATGAQHWTNAFATAQRYFYERDGERHEAWNNVTHLLYAGTRIAAASTMEMVREDAGIPSPNPIPLLPAGTATMAHRLNFTQFMDSEPGRLPCGLRTSVQGSSIPLDGRGFLLDAGCWVAHGVRAAKVVAIGGGSGSRDVRVELAYDERSSTSLPALWVWFREGTAYPVRIEMPATQAGQPVLWVHSLTSYAPGSGAIRMDAEPGPVPAPMPLSPRPTWTIDDRGVEHPFPLSVAFERARTDLEFDGLRGFLEAHPDAYVAAARHAAFDLDESTTNRWSIAVTDGSATYALDAYRHVRAQTVGGIPVPEALLPAATSYEFQELEDHRIVFGAPAGYLRPDELPAEMPTAAGLLAAWAMHAPQRHLEAGGDTWGFFLARDPDGPGGDPGLWLEAGRTRFVRTTGPAYPYMADYSDTWDTSGIHLYDGWDRIDSVHETTSRWEHNAAQSPAPPDVDGEAAEAVTPAGPVAALARSWGMPEGPVATGLSVGALLASLLYYLWPALKGGGLGLFSRVQTEQLLENQARAQIVAAVQASPGLHHQELVRIVGKGNGAAEHHIQKLLVAGLLKRHRSAGYTCYFAGAVDRRVMASAHLLKSPVARAVAQAAATRPGTSLAQVARELGVKVPSVHYHAKRLAEAGLVRWEGGLYPGANGSLPGAAAASASAA